MRRYLILLAFAAGLFYGCGTIDIPVDPPTPVPVVPVDPVNPPHVDPQPAVTVVPLATIQQIHSGMLRADVKTLVGVVPVFDTPQDDGTRIVRWATLSTTGEPKWTDVQFGTDDKVVEGRLVLIPRVP